MATKSLQFLLFGEDVTAGKAFKKLGAEAEASGTKVKGAFSKGAMVGVAGLAIGLGEAVKVAGEFQQKTNVLVTAAGESAANLGLIRKGIEGIAISTGTSIDQLTDAAYVAEKAGYRGADALTLMKAAAQGAREEGANLATVLNAQTSIMASYHLKASDSVMVINMMKTAAGEAKTTMENFAGSLSTVLPIASANKISFADVAGSLATLTQHGTSADEATQELSNTIRNLAKPLGPAAKLMAQLGIDSNDLSLKLSDGPGGRGLAGTLEYLSGVVLTKMGPSGLVLLNTFNKSKQATSDLNIMMGKLAPAAKSVATNYATGAITLGDYRKQVKALPADQANLLGNFIGLLNQSNGFNSSLKAGTPAAKTYSAMIQTLTGGVNGLNTTLQLTGESTIGNEARIKAIADAARDAGKDVDGWASTQKLFNVQLDMLKQRAEVAGIEIGTKLLPVLTSAAKFTGDHAKAITIAVGALVGLKVALIAYRLAVQTATAVQGIATGAMRLFGSTAATTAATVSAAEAEQTAAVTAAATKQTSLLAWTGESYIGLGAAAETSAATQVAANDSAAASTGRLRMSAGGAALGIAAMGLVVYEAGKKISDYTEKNNAAAHTLDGLSGQTTNLTTALVNNGGKLDDNVKSIVAAELAHTGLADKAAKAGITTDALSRAVTGSKDALGQLIQQWRASGKPSSDTIASLELQWSAYHQAAQGAANAAANTHAFSTELSKVPKNIHTSVTVSASAGNAFSVIRQVVDYANNQTAVIHVTATNPITGGTMGGRQAFASGTDYVPRSGMYTVGEQGRERVFLPKGSQVQTASATRMASGGGGMSLTLNITSPLASKDDIARAVVPALANFYKRGGARP